MSSNLHPEGFFQKFLNNEHFYKEKEIFSRLFKSLECHIISSGVSLKSSKSNSCCYMHLLRSIEESRLKGSVQSVICPKTRLQSFIFPVKDAEEATAGFICVFHSAADADKDIPALFFEAIKTVSSGVQKEIELAKLYDSLRPRAVALSTVHTLYRLISSTLDLDELLPRISRLSLQVLRANESSVVLTDNSKARLKIAAQAMLNSRFKKCNHKEYARLVVKSGNALLRRDVIAVPLIEEDISGVIIVCNKTDRTKFTSFDVEILRTLGEQAVIAIRNAKLYEEQESTAIGSIRSLAAVLDLKSPYTYTHTKCFERIAHAIAEKMNLSKEDIKGLHYAALLPDAGKVGIPENVLSKSARLTDREYKAIREHPLKGAKILRHINVLKPAIPVVLYHHERYDGTGYPYGLKGERIPIGARIMALADAFEAMVCKHRPYQKKKSIEEAVDEIRKSSGSQFDPKIVGFFLELYRSGRLESLYQEK